MSHISIRADDPAQVAKFYEKIFELKEAETYRDDGSICMTDGKVRLLLRPRDKSLYRGLREGLDHIGFKLESLQRVKDDLAAFALSAPEAVDGKLGVGGNGKKNEEDFRRCCLGQHFIADRCTGRYSAMRIGARARRSVERARRRFVDRIEWPSAELEQIHEHLLAVFEARRFQQSLLFRRVKRQRNAEKVH